VLPHITDDFTEARNIQHILTHLENKQAKNGWFCLSKQIQELLRKPEVKASMKSIFSVNMQ
jgi:hypothetical protein